MGKTAPKRAVGKAAEDKSAKGKSAKDKSVENKAAKNKVAKEVVGGRVAKGSAEPSKSKGASKKPTKLQETLSKMSQRKAKNAVKIPDDMVKDFPGRFRKADTKWVNISDNRNAGLAPQPQPALAPIPRENEDIVEMDIDQEVGEEDHDSDLSLLFGDSAEAPNMPALQFDLPTRSSKKLTYAVPQPEDPSISANPGKPARKGGKGKK